MRYNVGGLFTRYALQARNTRPSFADLIGKLEPVVSADIFLPFALFYAWPKWTTYAQRHDRRRATPLASTPVGLAPCGFLSSAPLAAVATRTGGTGKNRRGQVAIFATP